MGPRRADRRRLRRADHADLRRFVRRAIRPSPGPTTGWSSTTATQRKQAAIDFVKWLTAAHQVKSTSLTTADLPTRKSVGDDQAFVKQLNEKQPGTGVFVENLANVKKARPTVAQYPKISEALGQAIVSVLLGKAQPADALNAAAKTTDAALAEK